MKWTVARFPNGSWSTGGEPDDLFYEDCEVFVVEADSREMAARKAKEAHRVRPQSPTKPCISIQRDEIISVNITITHNSQSKNSLKRRRQRKLDGLSLQLHDGDSGYFQ